MRELIKEAIDGEVYTFGYLMTSEAVKVSIEVSKILLPAMGHVFSGIAVKKEVKDIAEANINMLNLDKCFAALADKLDPIQQLALYQKLVSVVTMDSGMMVFEEHFKGRPGHLLKVAKKSFEVNCGDFFESAIGFVGLKKTSPIEPAK